MCPASPRLFLMSSRQFLISSRLLLMSEVPMQVARGGGTEESILAELCADPRYGLI